MTYTYVHQKSERVVEDPNGISTFGLESHQNLQKIKIPCKVYPLHHQALKEREHYARFKQIVGYRDKYFPNAKIPHESPEFMERFKAEQEFNDKHGLTPSW